MRNSALFLSLSFAAMTASMTVPMTASAKTFVYCSEGSPSSFNPQLVTDGTSLNASLPVYEGLMGFENGSTKLAPLLAESYTISKDKLTYTFRLRKGVKFHTTQTFTPQRELNADDVVFSFERQFLKTNPYHNVSNANYEYFQSMEMGKVIKAVKAKDPMTVEISLNYAEAPFLANLAMPF